MLTRTFIHIPRISTKSEEKLWKSGITDWEKAKSTEMAAHIDESLQALETQDHRYFAEVLPKKEHWRCYRHFRPCFLDIETTGLSKHRNQITVVGLYDGEDTHILVHGKNLHTLPQLLLRYNMLITFNGIMFDVPFLQHNFPDADFSHLHIDLRFMLRRLGYSGGLKKIEKDLGISRGEDIADVDGRQAVRLWKKYQRGDQKALTTLMEYNRADVVNLKTLMEIAYPRMEQLALSCLSE
ncbi:MAG: ribonuclease H-like domain-containing protein [Nanoarchaeota archaeon]